MNKLIISSQLSNSLIIPIFYLVLMWIALTIRNEYRYQLENKLSNGSANDGLSDIEVQSLDDVGNIRKVVWKIYLSL